MEKRKREVANFQKNLNLTTIEEELDEKVIYLIC